MNFWLSARRWVGQIRSLARQRRGGKERPVFFEALENRRLLSADLLPTYDCPTWLVAQPGQSVEVRVPVANVGDEYAEPFDVRVYEVFGGEEPWIDAWERVGVLGAEEEETVTLSFTAPTEPGIYYLKFEVDASAEISENNEENNVSFGALIVNTLNNATMVGTWAIRGTDGTGGISLDRTGGITSGWMVSFDEEEGVTALNFRGQVNAEEEGAVGINLSFVGGTASLIGVRNRMADVLVMTDALCDTNFLGLAVRREGVYGLSDLNGTWYFIGPQAAIGYVIFNAGVVQEGLLYDEAGEVVTELVGSGNINAAGQVMMQIGSSLQDARQLVGEMNASRDLMIFANAGWPNMVEEEDENNPAGLLLTYRPMEDLWSWEAAGDWYLVGAGLFGRLTLGEGGQVNGQLIDAGGEQGRLLALVDSFWQIRETGEPQRDGQLYVSLTMQDLGLGAGDTVNVVGWVVASGDIVVLTEAEPEVNERSVVLLVRAGPSLRQPDLVGRIGRIQFPGAAIDQTRVVVVPGDKFTVPVTVINEGVDVAAGQIEVRVWASTDEVLDETDLLLGRVINVPVNLQPGASMTVRVTATVPPNTLGSYYILAQVDAQDVIKEVDETNNVALAMVGEEPVVMDVQWVFGQVGARRNVKLTLKDEDGTLVTFSLSGPGTGQVYSLDGQWYLQFTGTTTTSVATITTKKTSTPGDDGLVALAGIRVGGGDILPSAVPIGDGDDGVASLKSLTGKTTRLSGELIVTGWLGSLTLDDLNGVLIRIEDSEGVGMPISLTFDNVENTSLYSAVPIKSLSVRQWLNTDEEGDWIGPAGETDLWIGTLQSKGDFQAGLDLDRDPTVGLALSKATIGGRVGPETWRIGGNVGTISALGTPEFWNLEVFGNLRSLTFKNNATLNLYAGSVNTIKVTGNLGGMLSLEDDSVAQSLGTLTVGGWMESLKIWSAGNVGAITAGGAWNFHLVVGADQELIETGLAETADDFIGVYTLRRLTIRGIRGVTGPEMPAAQRLYVNAWNIGTINISGLETANDGQLHGFAAHSYRSWRLTDPSGRRINAVLNEPVDDFILRLIEGEILG